MMRTDEFDTHRVHRRQKKKMKIAINLQMDGKEML